MSNEPINIVWLKRDLRSQDHSPLLKAERSNASLIEAVKTELNECCGITTTNFIKLYNIPKALQKLTDLKYEMMPSETRLTDRLFLAGDTQLNASLNAAMISGERAALGVIASINTAI